jgi:hypothetical protein
LFKNRTAVSPLLNGPREKAPAILNSLYWSFFLPKSPTRAPIRNDKFL